MAAPLNILKSLLAVTFVMAVVLAATAWWIPVESAQNFAVSRATGDAYARFEAAGRAEALLWLARCLLPVVAATTLVGLIRRDRFQRFLQSAGQEFVSITQEPTQHPTEHRTEAPRRASVRCLVQRGLIVGWVILGVFRLGESIDARARDWPYFRWRSGAEVLPNISLENRMVIRYLWEATPPDSRILVLSDQSLFFLGYYLLPRVVLHPLHPESEFTIPRPGESRPAYRLPDLPNGYVGRVRPDYLLEYFESNDPELVNRRLEDRQWVAWWRRATGETGTPPYLVSLRPLSGTGL